MGRNKIKIEKIDNLKMRFTTYKKRKTGLLKKAMELSLLCDCEILLCIVNKTTKENILYESNSKINSLAYDYIKNRLEEEDEDRIMTYSNYEKMEGRVFDEKLSQEAKPKIDEYSNKDYSSISSKEEDEKTIFSKENQVDVDFHINKEKKEKENIHQKERSKTNNIKAKSKQENSKPVLKENFQNDNNINKFTNNNVNYNNYINNYIKINYTTESEMFVSSIFEKNNSDSYNINTNYNFDNNLYFLHNKRYDNTIDDLNYLVFN